jgi:hypothetical protein
MVADEIMEKYPQGRVNIAIVGVFSPVVTTED